MKEPPHPLLAHGQGAPCRRSRRDGHRRDASTTARNAAELVGVDYRSLPAVAGVDDAVKPGAPQLYDDVPGNLCCDWAIGDKAATEAAFAKAAHVHEARSRQQPAGAQRDGVAGRTGGVRARHRRLHALHLDASCRTSTRRLDGRASCCSIPEHKLRVVAPDVGGGFGSKQLSLCRGGAGHLGRGPAGAAGQVGRRAQREPSCPTRRAATTSPMPNWRSTRTASSWGCAFRRWPMSAPTSRPSAPTSRPISMDRCSPAPTPRRRSIAR